MWMNSAPGAALQNVHVHIRTAVRGQRQKNEKKQHSEATIKSFHPQSSLGTPARIQA